MQICNLQTKNLLEELTQPKRLSLATTWQVDFINKKESAKAELNENFKAFVFHVAFFTSKMTIYPARKAQIALLFAKKVNIPKEYSDFTVVFSKKSAEVLSNYTKIPKYAIKLKKVNNYPTVSYIA